MDFLLLAIVSFLSIAKDNIEPILGFLPVLRFCIPLSLRSFLPDFYPASSLLDAICTLVPFVETHSDYKMTVKLGWAIGICVLQRLHLFT